MTQKLEFTVESSGRRLDSYVAEQCRISRAYAQKLIEDREIAVNGRYAKASYRLNPMDIVAVSLPVTDHAAFAPLAAEDLPLEVVFEDSDLLVVDKPAGMVVHPAVGQYTGTLVNALLARYPDIADTTGSSRPGIVHRLDKDTSGLIVVAKNETARLNLARQMKQRLITKGYIALVMGTLSPQQGAIEAPIGRNPSDRKRMAVITEGKEARTQYQVIRYFDGYTLVEALLETGRTHQIRVHFSAIGHPIFGDPVYGRKSSLLGRQFLHAHRLGFKLPSNGKYVEFKSELPPDLEDVLYNITSSA
ncbi:MAG: RluA family pseudouridine synthase [Chloroflexota bacterium]|nr:RluA family pseudouridine synthase [Chloroflexota bacterium]